nr:hypothetical protein [Tanacetum cinerariifolium]
MGEYVYFDVIRSTSRESSILLYLVRVFGDAKTESNGVREHDQFAEGFHIGFLLRHYFSRTDGVQADPFFVVRASESDMDWKLFYVTLRTDGVQADLFFVVRASESDMDWKLFYVTLRVVVCLWAFCFVYGLVIRSPLEAVFGLDFAGVKAAYILITASCLYVSAARRVLLLPGLGLSSFQRSRGGWLRT